MKFRLFIIYAALLSPLLSFAQPYTITGTVKDSANNEAVINAIIRLQSMRDTALKYNAITDFNGNFTFPNLQGRGFMMTIRSMGYEVKEMRVFPERQSQLGVIKLKPDNKLLEEVEVTGVAQRAVQKGDTTQFNADAFKTNPDATAEDLIKKMPSVGVDGQGNVTAQGEQVKRVLVDGKPFFGDDPKTALKNLPAQAVDKIEVFNRKSDQSQFTGFNDGDDEKTINIITRPSFRNGTFGRVYAGYGTNVRYQAGGNINRFNNNQRISIVGLSNNINEQNFGNQDLLGVIGTSGNTQRGPRWMRGPTVESDPNDFRVGAQSGINYTNSIGVNYSDEWGKFKMNASYFYNQTDNRTEQLIDQNFFLTDTSNQYYRSSTYANSSNFNHRLNLRMEYKLNDKNTFIFTPNANFQNNSGFSQNDAQTRDFKFNLLNTSINRFSSDVQGYNVGGEALWQYKFDKKGRTFSMSLRGTASENDGATELIAYNTFFTGLVSRSDSINQEGLPINSSLRMRLRSTFTEPIGERGQLEIGHDYTRNTDNADQRTYNFDPETKIRLNLDTNLTNVFDNIFAANTLRTGYRLRTDKITYGVGVDYQYATLTSELLFPRSGEIFRPFNNILPNAMLMWEFSKQKSLRIFYRSGTQEPTVNQLQDVINNSNPLQLYIGNPTLQQSFNNRIFIRYNQTNTETARTFSAFGWVRQTNNLISTASLIASRDTLIGNVLINEGALLRYPVNLDGQWIAGANTTWGLPVAPLKSNMNISIGMNFNRTPGLINEQLNISNSLGITPGLTLASNFSEFVDFTLNWSGTINLVYNSLQPQLNNNFYIQNSGGTLSYIFWKGLVFRTSINHQWFAGLNDDFNQSIVLWNASLGKKLFKNNSGELSLSVFDLLNQNQSITRNVTEAYVQDIQTLVLRQYFMLTFTWNIRAFKES